LASTTFAAASRSFVSCSEVTMRRTLPFSIFCRPRVSRTVSSACSQGTLRSEIDILPLTSSPTTMFRPLSAARMRSRFTTSASLKSSEMSRRPFVVLIVPAGGAGVAGGGVGACANRTGGAATMGGAATIGGAATTGAGADATGSGFAGGVSVVGSGADGVLPGGVPTRPLGIAGATSRAGAAATTTGFAAAGAGFAAAGFAAAAGAVAPAGPSRTMRTPSGVSATAYVAERESWTTRRATPLRNWLPRISLIGAPVSVSGVLRQPYCVSSKSMTRRRGSISEAWYLGTPPVVTAMLVAPSSARTVTSVRRAGISAPAPATEINITTASPMRNFGMLLLISFVI
jgi:hypothetical protein